MMFLLAVCGKDQGRSRKSGTQEGAARGEGGHFLAFLLPGFLLPSRWLIYRRRIG